MTTFNPQWESPRAGEPIQSFQFPVGQDLVVCLAGDDDHTTEYDAMVNYGQDDRNYWSERYAESQEEGMRDEWC